MNILEAEVYVLEVEVLTMKTLTLSTSQEIARVAEERMRVRAAELQRLRRILEGCKKTEPWFSLGRSL